MEFPCQIWSCFIICLHRFISSCTCSRAVRCQSALKTYTLTNKIWNPPQNLENHKKKCCAKSTLLDIVWSGDWYENSPERSVMSRNEWDESNAFVLTHRGENAIHSSSGWKASCAGKMGNLLSKWQTTRTGEGMRPVITIRNMENDHGFVGKKEIDNEMAQ